MKLSQKSVSWLVILLFVAGYGLLAQEASKTSGAAIFKNKCVICHGADGSGNTPLGKQLQAANFHSKDVQKLSNAELHKIVHDGQANMPAFADQLSDEPASSAIPGSSQAVIVKSKLREPQRKAVAELGPALGNSTRLL